uniref:Myosin motor domain-containing protein n=1 Tax=Aegilops tauschii subsp. strangulata TaxID=200361 RepID=A0A452YHK4_AEGTS
SRVVQCAVGERSYHIFYQLCAGAPTTLREKLNLKKVDEYKYLKQSCCYSIAGVDDAEMFRAVTEAMNIVHISQEDQDNVFAMVSAVLWLGDVSFTIIDNENHVEITVEEAAETVSRLLGCSIEDLNLALSKRHMKVNNENIVQKLTLTQATDTRDALAKALYASLFEWLVEQINKSLSVGKRRTGRSISILDIYGFESFDKNSFEQFCINYANERLQQHFNRHLFKLEQEEYVEDGIDWAKVEFEDNQDCLNLFEKKPLGLLSLLDEESTFPNATDLTFANKLKQHLDTNSCFRGERGKAFTVRHYAGEVAYDTSGFLEKNRDLLHMDSIQFLAKCKLSIPQTFASKMLAQSDNLESVPYRPSVADSQKLSVAMKFKGQLFQLMQRLESTTPHFIRCIKPNNLQLPAIYGQELVLQQLKCCGVLEVVRISRSGYPTRMTHQKFARRYGFLLLEDVASQDPLSVSVAILHQFNILPEMYQVGYTKLFFRTGQIGNLENTRNRTLHGVLRVQSCFRGYQARRHASERSRGVLALQSFIRAENARQSYSSLLRKHRAATLVQKNLRGWRARRYFIKIRKASVVIQSGIRGCLVRRCAGNVDLLNVLREFESKKGGRRRPNLDQGVFPGRATTANPSCRGDSSREGRGERDATPAAPAIREPVARIRAENEGDGGDVAEADAVAAVEPVGGQEEPGPGRDASDVRLVRGAELGEQREPRRWGLLPAAGGGAADHRARDERQHERHRAVGGGAGAAEPGVRRRRQVPGGGQVRAGGREPEPGRGAPQAEAELRLVEEGLRLPHQGDQGDPEQARERRRRRRQRVLPQLGQAEVVGQAQHLQVLVSFLWCLMMMVMV